mgnify:FL=1|jgi:hypothetical protein
MKVLANQATVNVLNRFLSKTKDGADYLILINDELYCDGCLSENQGNYDRFEIVESQSKVLNFYTANVPNEICYQLEIGDTMDLVIERLTPVDIAKTLFFATE